MKRETGIKDIGELQGRQAAIAAILEARFGELDPGLREALSTLEDRERLQWLSRQAALVTDQEEFRQLLNSGGEVG